MSILTLSEMRKIILQNNGAVAWKGTVISKQNIHQLPTEAEWAVSAGQNFDVVAQDLDKQMAELQRQKELLSAGKEKLAELQTNKVADSKEQLVDAKKEQEKASTAKESPQTIDDEIKDAVVSSKKLTK